MGYKFNPFTGNLDNTGLEVTALNTLGVKADLATIQAIVGPSVGDVWQADDTDIFYLWDGSAWVSLGTLGTAVAAIDDLTDVVITTPSDGQVLEYDSATSQWVNATPTGGGGGGGTPGGSDTQIQFNDAGSFGGDVDLTWNKTTNVMTVGGDIDLDDGGTYTTTLQTITPTANRTISFPDATGTVGLVAGSSGQLVYNNAGAYAGASGSSVGASGDITLSANGAASTGTGSAFKLTGSWYTGADPVPQALIQPAGTATSTTWSTSGTGLGVNAASTFNGNLLDLQVNGTSKFSVTPNIFTFKGHEFHSDANALVLTNSSGTRSFLARHDFSLVTTSAYFGWGNLSSFASDLRFYRDDADTLAQRRGGTNAAPVPQTFRLYNFSVDPANDYERTSITDDSTGLVIDQQYAGTGAVRTNLLDVKNNGTSQLRVSYQGDIYSGGGNIFIPDSRGYRWNSRGSITAPSDGLFQLANSTATGFSQLRFGGGTTSFPSLKRNNAVLETKLADDSGYAQHAASVFEAATAHTVAGLPGTPTVGMIARVTDGDSGLTFGQTVVNTGAGSTPYLCWYNGTNWTVIGA